MSGYTSQGSQNQSQQSSQGQSQGMGVSAGASQSQGSSQQYGQGQATSESGTAVVPGMLSVYNQLLGQNQQHYGNVMAAYAQGQGNLGANLPSLYQQYPQLQQNVMNTLGMGQVLGQNGNWGIASPAAQQIARQTAQQGGALTQQMTNAGLGNTTAVANAQNQNTYNSNLAYGALGAQLAGTAAQYQSQIGQAGAQAQMQGLGLQTGLTQGALNPLGAQLSNTAGQLTGPHSASQSYNYQGGQSQQAANAYNYAVNQQAAQNASRGTSSGTSSGQSSPYMGGGGEPNIGSNQPGPNNQGGINPGAINAQTGIGGVLGDGGQFGGAQLGFQPQAIGAQGLLGGNGMGSNVGMNEIPYYGGAGGANANWAGGNFGQAAPFQPNGADQQAFAQQIPQAKYGLA